MEAGRALHQLAAAAPRPGRQRGQGVCILHLTGGSAAASLAQDQDRGQPEQWRGWERGWERQRWQGWWWRQERAAREFVNAAAVN